MKTKEEIIKSNRLIAEFMEYEHDNYEGDDDSITYNCADHLVNTSDREAWDTTIDDWNSWLRADEMLFHSSWDWLMPVVEKIEDDTGWELVMYSNDCFWNKYGQRPEGAEYYYTGRRIKAVYGAVVEFITWYNDSK